MVNLSRDIIKKNDFITNNHKILEGRYSFVNAVDGQTLNLENIGYNKDKAIKYLKREMSSGEIGCYLSHMNIYQEVVDKNLPYALIFEDDITIIDDNFLYVVDLVAQKHYYDICLLRYQYKKRDKIKDMFYEHLDDTYDMLKISKREWGTYGYIISNNACRKLLKYKNDIFMPIDTLGRDKHFDKFLDIYCVYPNLIEVDTKNSSLEQERINYKKQSSKNNFIKHILSYFR